MGLAPSYRLIIRSLGVMALVFFVSACSDNGYDPYYPVSDVPEFEGTVATDWMNLMMGAVRTTPGYSPPVASRAYGYAGITLYESVVHGIPKGRSLKGQINSLTEMPLPQSGKRYHWAIVANAAMADMMRNFFPKATDSIKQKITELEERNLYERRIMGIDEEIISRSVEYGKDVAETVFQYSRSDGGHEGYSRNFPSTYQVPRGEGLWVPTPPARQAIPMQPYWGKNRSFTLPMSNPILNCDPGPHATFSKDSGSAFYNEAYEVYNTVKHLTPAQREIALFWSDDPGATATPPGHSISILTQLLQEKGSRLDVAARAYAAVGMAVSDAFIACWEVKYKYNLIRPISYIQQYIDPEWNRDSITDPLITPPFPEYTSGHSVQGGASFQVMKMIFGNIGFVDKTHVRRGFAPRRFGSMDEAMQENAISRLYGGIHYRTAIDRGVAMGNDIGKQIMTKIQFSY